MPQAELEQSYDFDLGRKRVDINLKKEEDGSLWPCYLEEMTGTVRDNYLQGNKNRVDRNKQDITDFKDVQASYIAICLKEKATEKPVGIEAIREFPASVQNKLHEIAAKLNGFDQNAEATAKNS